MKTMKTFKKEFSKSSKLSRGEVPALSYNPSELNLNLPEYILWPTKANMIKKIITKMQKLAIFIIASLIQVSVNSITLNLLRSFRILKDLKALKEERKELLLKMISSKLIRTITKSKQRSFFLK